MLHEPDSHQCYIKRAERRIDTYDDTMTNDQTAEIARLKAELSEIREAEGACCPEDQSFAETIAALRTEIDDLARKLEVAKVAIVIANDWDIHARGYNVHAMRKSFAELKIHTQEALSAIGQAAK